MASRTSVTWRYLSRGKAKHALRIDSLDHAGHDATALCGVTPAWFMPSSEQWCGTGSQVEYETVEVLPECRRCTRLLAELGETP